MYDAQICCHGSRPIPATADFSEDIDATPGDYCSRNSTGVVATRAGTGCGTLAAAMSFWTFGGSTRNSPPLQHTH